MIKSFRDDQTERLFERERERVKKFSKGVQGVALRKLVMLDAAADLGDLRVPPGNRLEKLKGDRKGQYRLLHEFLGPNGISQYRLAKDISVPPRRVNEIVKGRRAVTANTALRLARYFGTSERFWLNLQAHYELEVERDRLGKRLEKEIRVLAKRNEN